MERARAGRMEAQARPETGGFDEDLCPELPQRLPVPRQLDEFA